MADTVTPAQDEPWKGGLGCIGAPAMVLLFVAAFAILTRNFWTSPAPTVAKVASPPTRPPCKGCFPRGFLYVSGDDVGLTYRKTGRDKPAYRLTATEPKFTVIYYGPDDKTSAQLDRMKLGLSPITTKIDGETKHADCPVIPSAQCDHLFGMAPRLAEDGR